MARRRYVSTTISTDKMIAKLANENGEFSALLYTWMIPHATDDGGITADPEELRLMVIPGFKKKDAAAIQKAISAMLALGLLELSESADRLYFPAESFYKHQSYINAANRRKTPEITANHRRTPQLDITPEARYETAEIAGNQRESAQNAASPPPSPSVSLSPSVGVEDARDEISQIVSDFAQYGTTNALTVGYVEDAVEEYTLDWVQRAVAVGAKGKASGDQPPWNYIEKTLQRWRTQGEPDDDKPRQLQPAGRSSGPQRNGVDLNDLDARLARL